MTSPKIAPVTSRLWVAAICGELSSAAGLDPFAWITLLPSDASNETENSPNCRVLRSGSGLARGEHTRSSPDPPQLLIPTHARYLGACDAVSASASQILLRVIVASANSKAAVRAIPGGQIGKQRCEDFCHAATFCLVPLTLLCCTLQA